MGVRARPSGTFYAESAPAALASPSAPSPPWSRRCTPTTWRHGASGAPANSSILRTASLLVGFDSLVTAEQRRYRQQIQRRLAIAHADERAMEAWAAAFPRDILDERAFYEQKKADRRAEKEAIRAGKPFIEVREVGPTTIDGNNDC
nr:uncharacterized protein LOC127339291 [Lolium perenne]